MSAAIVIALMILSAVGGAVGAYQVVHTSQARERATAFSVEDAHYQERLSDFRCGYMAGNDLKGQRPQFFDISLPDCTNSRAIAVEFCKDRNSLDPCFIDEGYSK